MFIHYLTYLFLFCIVVLTEQYKSVRAKKYDFYHKVIEAKWGENFRLKAGYTAGEQRLWRFSVNKNYCIKDIYIKINGEKQKSNACTSYFFFMFLKHAQ